MPFVIAADFNQRVQTLTAWTAFVGLGPNKNLVKLCHLPVGMPRALTHSYFIHLLLTVSLTCG